MQVSDLSWWILEQRRLKHMTRDMFAKKIGFHITTIALWEKGKTIPTMYDLGIILDFFGYEMCANDKVVDLSDPFEWLNRLIVNKGIKKTHLSLKIGKVRCYISTCISQKSMYPTMYWTILETLGYEIKFRKRKGDL